MIAEGSAFLDHSGRVLAADGTFAACLRLPAADVTAAPRESAPGNPTRATHRAGTGPHAGSRSCTDGGVRAELVRVASPDGRLLRARAAAGASPAPVDEYAMQA